MPGWGFDSHPVSLSKLWVKKVSADFLFMNPRVFPDEFVNLLAPRLKDEFTAFYVYRAASNWLKGVGFETAAAFFAKESEDELAHAKKLESFLVDWNVNVALPLISAPPVTFQGLQDVIERAYRMEVELYDQYQKTAAAFLAASDFATLEFLSFFLEQQRMSVAEYSDMLNLLQGVDTTDKFKMVLLQEELFGA